MAHYIKRIWFPRPEIQQNGWLQAVDVTIASQLPIHNSLKASFGVIAKAAIFVSAIAQPSFAWINSVVDTNIAKQSAAFQGTFVPPKSRSIDVRSINQPYSAWLGPVVDSDITKQINYVIPSFRVEAKKALNSRSVNQPSSTWINTPLTADIATQVPVHSQLASSFRAPIDKATDVRSITQPWLYLINPVVAFDPAPFTGVYSQVQSFRSGNSRSIDVRSIIQPAGILNPVTDSIVAQQLAYQITSFRSNKLAGIDVKSIKQSWVDFNIAPVSFDPVPFTSLFTPANFTLRPRRAIQITQIPLVDQLVYVPTVPGVLASFSNLRVESNAYNQVTIRWSYDGANQVAIYRSTAGGSYVLLVDDLDPTEVIYIDETVVADTHYDYKLSDDGGVTFSSVAGVHSQLQAVDIANRQNDALVPPQFIQEEDVNAQNLQFLSQAVQTTVQNQTTSTNRCIVCPVDGALVLDCSNGCFSFVTTIDATINSITVIGCTVCPDVMFLIPATITAGICGWPGNCFFAGDECFQAPLTGPRTAFTDGTTRDGLGLPRGEGCFCESVFPFNIQCCEDDHVCELACDGKQSITLKACGGIGPYRWSKTGNVRLSSTVGETIKVSVVGGTGGGDPGVAGIACTHLSFRYIYNTQGSCVPADPAQGNIQSFSGSVYGQDRATCGGNFFSTNQNDLTTRGTLSTHITAGPTCLAFFPPNNVNCTFTTSSFNNCISSGTGSQGPGDGGTITIATTYTNFSSGVAASHSIGATITPPLTEAVVDTSIILDYRSASMIALGCPPCEGECDLSDVIISVTDALGRTATISGT